MLVEPATGEKAGPGDAIFSGPRTQCLTANPGPVHTITALFFADALHRLTGIDMSTQINNMAELGAALGDEWRLCRHSCWLPRTMRPASPCWKNGWSRDGGWSVALRAPYGLLSTTACRRSPCALEQRAWDAAHDMGLTRMPRQAGPWLVIWQVRMPPSLRCHHGVNPA